MRINEFIDKVLNKSILKKVRIRVDPRESCHSSFHLSSSYEGYILEENDTTVKIYLVNAPLDIDPIQQVSKKHIIEPAGSAKNFVQKLVELLIQSGVSQNNPVLQQIKNLKNLEFLETYLKQLDLDDKKISGLYKKLCLLQTEGVADILTDPKTVEIMKLGGKAVDLMAGAPKLLLGKEKSIFGRMARFLKSFDINDLISFSNVVATAGGEKTKKPSMGTLVYITGLDGLKLSYDKNKTPYNLIGRLERETLNQEEHHYDFKIVEPATAGSVFPRGYISFSLFDNRTSGGLCIIKRTKNKNDKKICFEAKFNKFKNTILVTAGKQIDERDAIFKEPVLEIQDSLALLKGLSEIVNYQKLNQRNQGYLVILSGHAHNREELKKKIIDIAARLSETEEYKALADENQKLDMLRNKLEANSIKTTY